jgi:hypothetical protein
MDQVIVEQKIKLNQDANSGKHEQEAEPAAEGSEKHE